MNPADFKDIITGIVLLGGALGAAWKWGFSEILRRRSEIPTLDGHFSARCLALDQSTTAVELCAVWRNKGTVPVFANCKATTVNIFRIEPTEDRTNTKEWRKHKPIITFKPFEDRAFYYMEPGTDTEIQTIHLLPSESMFVAKFQLVIPVPRSGRGRFARSLRRFSNQNTDIEDVLWVRDHLFSTHFPVNGSTNL
jgi:hypothetical protein